MTDTTTATPEKVALADHADRIFEVLRHRDPTDADAQACSMVIAGLRMLGEVRGAEAVCAFLGKAAPIMAGRYPGGPLEMPPAVSALETPAQGSPPTHEETVAHGLAYLRSLPLGAAMAEANAAMEISGAFLHQARGDLTGADAGPTAEDATRAPDPSAPATEPRNPDGMALALLDGLRGLSPDAGHEQARAAIAGAGAFLIEARGPAYTAAVVDGLLTNAQRHIEVWGASPRPDGASLH